jgi:cysteine synthase A
LILLQFEKSAIYEIHKKQHCIRIIKAFPDGLDYMITGVETGGHTARLCCNFETTLLT